MENGVELVTNTRLGWLVLLILVAAALLHDAGASPDTASLEGLRCAQVNGAPGAPVPTCCILMTRGSRFTGDMRQLSCFR